MAFSSTKPTRLWSRTWVIGWLPAAWVLLGLCRLALLLVPWRRLAGWFGKAGGGTGDGIGGGPVWLPLATPRQRWQAARLGRAVRLAARLAPWRADCMPQALCARLLLGLHRIPCGLYLGVAREIAREDGDAVLSAHAWVATGPVAVTGGAGFDRFRVIAWFVAMPSLPRQRPTR